MALDYLDNTSSRSEKAHDSYYRALQKSNQSVKKNKPNNAQKSNNQPVLPFSEQISCWVWIRQWQSKHEHTNWVLDNFVSRGAPTYPDFNSSIVATSLPDSRDNKQKGKKISLKMASNCNSTAHLWAGRERGRKNPSWSTGKHQEAVVHRSNTV